MTQHSEQQWSGSLEELVALEAEERASDRPLADLLVLYDHALKVGNLPATLRERFERWRDGRVRTLPGTPESFEAAFRSHLAEHPPAQ
jgi:hypothetical protein